MAKIDEIKEELNYLKVWRGIIVITTIGLISSRRCQALF